MSQKHLAPEPRAGEATTYGAPGDREGKRRGGMLTKTGLAAAAPLTLSRNLRSCRHSSIFVYDVLAAFILLISPGRKRKPENEEPVDVRWCVFVAAVR